MDLEREFDKAQTLARKRVIGDQTLTFGELVGFILALLVMFLPRYNPVPQRWRIPLGLLIILATEILF